MCSKPHSGDPMIGGGANECKNTKHNRKSEMNSFQLGWGKATIVREEAEQLRCTISIGKSLIFAENNQLRLRHLSHLNQDRP